MVILLSCKINVELEEVEVDSLISFLFSSSFISFDFFFCLLLIIIQQKKKKKKGNFEIWRYDGQDAYDTCEWISQQEWSNGKVFTFGVSADGVSVYTQILYDNPWLKAQFPVFGVANGHELVYPGGVYLKNVIYFFSFLFLIPFFFFKINL